MKKMVKIDKNGNLFMSELKQKQLVSHRNQSTDLQSKSVIQDTVCSLIVLNKCS